MICWYNYKGVYYPVKVIKKLNDSLFLVESPFIKSPKIIHKNTLKKSEILDKKIELIS